MNIQEYIRSELIVLIPVLYMLGVCLKHSRVPDRWIPAVLGITAIVLSAVWVMSGTDVGSPQEFFAALFTAVTQGVLLAGTSVYIHQLYKQSRDEKKTTADDTDEDPATRG